MTAPTPPPRFYEYDPDDTTDMSTRDGPDMPRAYSNGGQRENHYAKYERAEEEDPLTERETLFVELFCTKYQYDKRNRGKCAVEAGYSPNQVMKSLWNRPRVQKAILERMRYEQVNAAEVVNKLGIIFRSDFKKFHHVEWRNERVEEWYEEQEAGVDAEGNACMMSVIKSRTMLIPTKRVVQDFAKAYDDDETYAIKDVEYYKDGVIKRVTFESKLEAIKLLGAVFGLFGNKEAGDDWGRNWQDRAQANGYPIEMVVKEMVQMLISQGHKVPFEIVEGMTSENAPAEATLAT